MSEHSEGTGKRSMESARRKVRRERSRDRRSPEPDRRKDRREDSRGRHLSGAMSCHPEEDIQARGVMASRHYLSRMPPDRSHIMDESREVMEDRCWPYLLRSACRTYCQLIGALSAAPKKCLKIDCQAWQPSSCRRPVSKALRSHHCNPILRRLQKDAGK